MLRIVNFFSGKSNQLSRQLDDQKEVTSQNYKTQF